MEDGGDGGFGDEEFGDEGALDADDQEVLPWCWRIIHISLQLNYDSAI
jgi:hypothetical protein